MQSSLTKEAMRSKAHSHYNLMEQHFPNKIMECVSNTKLYDVNFVFDNPKIKPTENQFIFEDLDTISAMIKYYSTRKMAVLNFASYKNPGGRFLDGSMAQEEVLCHNSILYNVLSRFPEYYAWNNKYKNKGLYTNRALYTPNVLFCPYDGVNTFVCDVITCAAPNKSAGWKYRTITENENYVELNDRIHFVLDIAAENNVDTLILGAFGCGTFGQNPNDVASLFDNCLQSTHYNRFNRVIFAVPHDLNIANHMSFMKVFSQGGK